MKIYSIVRIGDEFVVRAGEKSVLKVASRRRAAQLVTDAAELLEAARHRGLEALMGTPVPRMSHAPDTDPFHVHWPTEVVLVLRLLLPASLSGRLGSGPAGRFWAVLLPTAVAHVHGENLPADRAARQHQ